MSHQQKKSKTSHNTDLVRKRKLHKSQDNKYLKNAENICRAGFYY